MSVNLLDSVPQPTLAAGWETSISLRIALPSFVSTIPPLASSSILSMARGPSVVLTISATACTQWESLWDGQHLKLTASQTMIRTTWMPKLGKQGALRIKKASKNLPWLPARC